MKTVNLKYNPYLLQTEVQVDGQAPPKGGRLDFGQRRMQEWIDDFPGLMLEEYGVREFELNFNGILIDYEDVEDMAENAEAKGFYIKLNYLPAAAANAKEENVRVIFEMIKDGPCAELKKPDVLEALEKALSSDFEISVVATMSAGKSTLINSLLGQRLMPAQQEACTATITEIRDNDADHFEAKVLDFAGQVIETCSNLTCADMERFNSNPQVSKICVEGDIPFLPADEVSLVLIDTPGPNNSRDPAHKAATYRMLSETSRTLILYVLNATQLAVDDDNTLLKHVADTMRSGGKQARDRFIFVVNKLDDFIKGEDSVEAALTKVTNYLADHDIHNPRVYPISALTALNVRTILAQDDLDDDDDAVYAAKGKVRKLNRHEELYLERYAPLPTSRKKALEERLQQAIEKGDANEQALLHSGLVSLEEAISIYAFKYAKTAKFKDAVDAILARIASERSFELVRNQIAELEIAFAEKASAIEAWADAAKSQWNSIFNLETTLTKVKSYQRNAYLELKPEEVVDECMKASAEQLEAAEKVVEGNEARNFLQLCEQFAVDSQVKFRTNLSETSSARLAATLREMISWYEKGLRDMTVWLEKDGLAVSCLKQTVGDDGNVCLSPDTSSWLSLLQSRLDVLKVNLARQKYLAVPWDKGDPSQLASSQEALAQSSRLERDAALTECVEVAIAKLEEDSSFFFEWMGKRFTNWQERMIGEFENLAKLPVQRIEELQTVATELARADLAAAQRKLAWLEDLQSRVNAIVTI